MAAGVLLPISGGCHCGAVRLELTKVPTFQFLCHCDNCRRLNGGLRLAGVSFSADALSVTGKTQSYRYAGGKAFIDLHFCGTCGTGLYADPKAYDGVVVVRANALDDPGIFEPQKSIFAARICSWDLMLAGPAANA